MNEIFHGLNPLKPHNNPKITRSQAKFRIEIQFN